MKKTTLLLVLLAFGSLLAITGCTSMLMATTHEGSQAAQTVHAYLEALTSRQKPRLLPLVCGDWEAEAVAEFDSLGTVAASLQNVNCQESGQAQGDKLVTCQGSIIFNYNGESQDLDLSKENYRVRLDGARWLICGRQ